MCTKNNHITRFGPSLFNTISYITIHLKYITLIKKQISMYKNVKNQYPRGCANQSLVYIIKTEVSFEIV